MAKKSRYGCLACKARKVKCDETKPVCSNCQRFGVDCEQLVAGSAVRTQSANAGSLPSSPAASTGSQSHGRRDRGRPRKSLAFQQIPENAGPDCASASTPLEKSYSTKDMQLMLHFVTSTARTLCNAQSLDDPTYWHFTNEIPSLALTHSLIFDFICAITSLHLSYNAKDSTAKSEWKLLAEARFQEGLSEYGKQFEIIHSTSTKTIAATLVCYYTLAIGPRSATDILLCDIESKEDVPWIQLLWGVRTLMESNRSNKDLSSPELGTPDSVVQQSKLSREDNPLHDIGRRWREPVQELMRSLACTQSDKPSRYLQHLENMTKIFRALEGQDTAADSHGEEAFILGWLYRLDNDFVASLGRKSPLPLIVFSFYTVLLRTMESDHWWACGWADHILHVIKDNVPDEFASWLAWPLEEALASTRTA